MKTIRVPHILGERGWYLQRVNYATKTPCPDCEGKGKFPSPNGKATAHCPTCIGIGTLGEDKFEVHWTTPVELTWLCHTEATAQKKETRIAWSESFPNERPDGYHTVRNSEGLKVFPTEAAAIRHAIKNKLRFALRLESKRTKWAKRTPSVDKLARLAWSEDKESEGLLKYNS